MNKEKQSVDPGCFSLFSSAGMLLKSLLIFVNLLIMTKISLDWATQQQYTRIESLHVK